ncbi:ejaculatory bulb-specific protein 3-like [Daphnia pulex]|uniref:ejaculatory bulb-specific protein 3-like n=1 Tax=Daphnia pulex TaxID=6669 RepID=UPI001EDEED01|nr:ejaculatory bulb-specific protein 3-like [Daphnia pulex]XP_046649123.1 ejaculatory bulb-specific protein 3-like [Daphnia pulicaria]
MKSTVVVLVVLAALAATVSAQLALENVDVDNVLKNEKLVKRYIDCTLERGRCEQNGRDLKVMIPRVLNEGCSGCTPKQVENSNRIIKFMKDNHPGDWAAIETKYKTG